MLRLIKFLLDLELCRKQSLEVTAGLNKIKEAFAQYHESQKDFVAGNGINLTFFNS
jgi:hypothetical protein